MQRKGANISLKGYDDIFSTEQSRAESQQERVQEIPLSELHPFEGHPFRVVDDEEMMKTAESVRDFGVLTPAIVRPDPDGGYEIVSGHRRHRASELAGKETMPAIVRDLDDDAAIILMVDANLQRETILPSERAFVAVMLITNTFNITMAVFDVAQHVVNASGGIIAGNTAIDASGLEALEETLQGMDLGPLIGLLLQSFVVQITMSALAIIIFVIVYGRMIEIYLMVSLAPIPFSTFANREQNQIGQNYLRSLFALGFQGFLIIICVGIYAVLVQSLAFTDDIIADIWGIMGYTVLLCFTLFKTGTLAKSVFNAH